MQSCGAVFVFLKMLIMIELYHGDCLIEMDKIADKSVDMILCDLPYAVTAFKWDSFINLRLLWNCYDRILKDNATAIFTATQPFSSILVTGNIKMFKYSLVWDKLKGTSFAIAKKKPMVVVTSTI